ncbi:hypothetical protein F5X99DRAFT_417508 [Biscogniauxia marginata]|nr:hypothetical protein F5X99DRAFT_417508 [Biscogniauxia marginata]
MDALLDSPRSNQVCSSVQDLQSQLHKLLATKSSDTRAEHASFTFELRYNTVFYLTAESEDGAADGVDPAQSHQQPISRTVNASETVQNQPTDDPALQKAVAKHIISAIGAVDGSSWSVRLVARGAQGWTFTYICKDSLQAWNRANAKNTERPVIGDYSGAGGLDTINLSRPAFDCRGTLTIAFSKANRAVVAKYEHTPFHKTVVQLVDRLAPSLPPPPVNNGSNSSQRTPKAKRPPPAEGEESNRKKRKRKGKAPEAPMMGVAPVGHESTTQNNEGPQNASPSGVHLTSILNVPPAEAERRRQTAIELLSGRGIDPATLSAEQFNIFANQAPNLQSASLDMLAKYGAERLRIVHPDDNKTQATSSNSTPTQERSTDATPTTGPTTSSASGAAETPSKKRRSKKKSDGVAAEVPIGDGAVLPLEQTGEIGTTESALQPKGRKTRGACNTCKQRKLKCTKEHPICLMCRDAGVECVYLPPKPRRKSEKHSEGAEREDSDVPGEVERFERETEPQVQTPAQIPDPEPEPEPEPVDIQHPPAPDPDNEEFIPDPNILSGPQGNDSPTLTFPQPIISAPQSHSKQAASRSGRRIPPPGLPAQQPSWNTSPSTGHKTTPGAESVRALSQAAIQASSQPPQATQSPYQNAARTKSRQGHRSQTSTPVANTARPPPQAPRASQPSSSSQQPTTNTSYNNTTPVSSSMPTYDPYARYSSNADQYTATDNDHGSSRIPYEPGSYQTNPTTTASVPYTSAPSYDYTRSTASANPLSQALNTPSGYTTTSNPTTNQWPASHARSSSNQYSMSSATAATSHGYGARPTDTRASNQNASYNQATSQAYPSYSTQAESAGQQSQQNWYGLGTTNSNNQASYASNKNSGYSGASAPAQTGSYGSHRSSMGYSNHGYGGTDDPSIYDLLRTGSNNN